MAIAGMPESSLRLERAESSRLAWAFTISVALHLVFFGTFQTGKKLGWWQRLHWPAWLQSARMLTEVLKKKENPAQPRQEMPVMFVDVNPAMATAEPPKNAAYYSDKNSKAANPEPDKDSNTPKISGRQTQIIRTEDVPRTKAFPLQPTPPAEQAKAAQEELKPKSTYAPGDLALAKPEAKPRKDEGEAPRARPRTIAEALARQSDQLTGQKTKQEGGVKRRSPIESSLDAIATPFGAYDKAIIAAVEHRWFYLLDTRDYTGERTGKVTLRFHLNSDGSVSEMSFVENTVDLALGLLCQSAITDSTPFAPWPREMKFQIGADYREVTFTFYYN